MTEDSDDSDDILEVHQKLQPVVNSIKVNKVIKLNLNQSKKRYSKLSIGDGQGLMGLGDSGIFGF